MNSTFKSGYQAAKIWHRNGLEFTYSHPRDDYERGWNSYVAHFNRRRRVANIACKVALVLAIAALIYIALLTT